MTREIVDTPENGDFNQTYGIQCSNVPGIST